METPSDTSVVPYLKVTSNGKVVRLSDGRVGICKLYTLRRVVQVILCI